MDKDERFGGLRGWERGRKKQRVTESKRDGAREKRKESAQESKREHARERSWEGKERDDTRGRYYRDQV